MKKVKWIKIREQEKTVEWGTYIQEYMHPTLSKHFQWASDNPKIQALFA